MAYPVLALYDRKIQRSASLIHFSMDVHLPSYGEEAIVSLGLLFENDSGYSLVDAEFTLRLPEEARVNYIECEVERTRGNMLLRAPEERLENRYGMHTARDGPLFLCRVGTISAEKDVVIFMSYNFRPIWSGAQVQLSLPFPRKQPERYPGSYRFGINLEFQEVFSVVEVDSNTHRVTPTLAENKARIAVLYPVPDVDMDLVISIDNRLEIPPPDSLLIPDAVHWKAYDGNHVGFPSKSMREAYSNPEKGVEELYTDDQMVDIVNMLKEPYSAGSCASNYTDTSSQCFLDESEVASESDPNYILVNCKENETPLECSDSDTSMKQDECFETEGAWLSGGHPLTSWLQEFDSDEKDFTNGCNGTLEGSLAHDRPTEHLTRPIYFGQELQRRLNQLGNINLQEQPELPRDILLYTPPPTPVTPDEDESEVVMLEDFLEPETTTLSEHMAALGPEEMMRSLINILHWSPSLFFELNHEFSIIVGVPLNTLLLHPGAQAFKLPNIWQWIKTGIWANAVAFQFLNIYCSPLISIEKDNTKRAELEQQLNTLCYRICSPVTDHDWYRGATCEGLSFVELGALARELLMEIHG